ncbi:MAG: hypothetical protein EBV06_05470 [Planctomycetia bacterium]|nr:hypothetical protein [Planctomycetia bacterium]
MVPLTASFGRACVPGTCTTSILCYHRPGGHARYLRGATSLFRFGPLVRLGRGAFSALSFGDSRARLIPLGRLGLCQLLAAWSLMRSKGALGAYLRRQRGRLGAPKAITAAAHKLARIVYHLMRYGEAYVKQTEKEYAAEVRERQEKQLKRRAKELGYELTKVEPPAE